MKKYAIITSLFLFILTNSFAQSIWSVEIHCGEVFNVPMPLTIRQGNNPPIKITNKYGKIELNTWKKDSVVIRFRMEINEKKPDKLTKTLDNLDFNPEAKFNFRITETKTDMDLGRELKVEDKEVLDAKENKNRHSGYFGKKMQDDQLIINSVNGEINVLTYWSG